MTRLSLKDILCTLQSIGSSRNHYRIQSTFLCRKQRNFKHIEHNFSFHSRFFGDKYTLHKPRQRQSLNYILCIDHSLHIQYNFLDILSTFHLKSKRTIRWDIQHIQKFLSEILISIPHTKFHFLNRLCNLNSQDEINYT